MASRTKIEMIPAGAHPAARPGLLQRKCACGGRCADCDGKKLSVQRASDKSQSRPPVPASVRETLRSAGRPLDAPTRSFMEPRFGHDFSKVRIHTDAKASESARTVNALAYTLGSDIVFAAGRYAPHSVAGRRLLAHELTHVVQQRGGLQPKATALEVAAADGALEREADAAAEAVTRGLNASPVRAGRLNLARQIVGSVEPAARDATSVAPPLIPPKTTYRAPKPCTPKKGGCFGGKWKVEYDGCSLPAWLAGFAGIDKDNPAGGLNTQFALCGPSADSHRPCDRHDECYQTCNPTLTAKAACDARAFADMISVCTKYSSDGPMLRTCLGYAQSYYAGLVSLGLPAFMTRQAQVCNCHPPNYTLPSPRRTGVVEPAARDATSVAPAGVLPTSKP